MRTIVLLLLLITTCISAKAQLFVNNGDDGYYYDHTGNKISGFIKVEDGLILFKTTKREAMAKKILAADISGYVIGTDSFVVSRNPVFKNPVFLKVLINNTTKLYFYKADERINFEPVFKDGATGPSSGFKVGTGKKQNKYYFYGANADELLLLTEENFEEVMSDIMADKPEIVERVKDKTITIKNVVEWVIFYNQEKAAAPVAIPADK